MAKTERPEHSAAPDLSVPRLDIRLFGPATVLIGGEPLPRLRSRKGLWLLALLSLRSGREVEREWLAGTLWPDSGLKQAYYNLRENLSDLRKALGNHGSRIVSPSIHTVSIELAPSETDVLAFDEDIRRGDYEGLEKAVALYRGPLLEGCLEEWVASEREPREQAYVGALLTLADKSISIGEHDAAVRRLRIALSVDPLRENVHRQLMQSLAATGSHAAARIVYRDLRLLLHREVNSEPDPDTTALFEKIRAEERSAVLKAVPRKEPVSRAFQEGRRAAPHPITPIVGRHVELEEIRAAIKTSRLVTLTGPGGVGKTRLALQLAVEAANSLPDGSWWVDLAALSRPDQVVTAVAKVASILDEVGQPTIDTLTEALGSSNGIIFLDNCEHLIDECARISESLLSRSIHLRILATSRQPLGITGERIYRTPSLSLPDPGSLGESRWRRTSRGRNSSSNPLRLSSVAAEKSLVSILVEFDAVRLLVQRAGEASPGFALTSMNAKLVYDICRRLDGIPLALELVAARLRTLDLEEISRRLDDRFRLLSQGSRTALPRHRTLAALIDWSYNLLSGQEQMLLRRLSVFNNGWTLAAAEQVCSDEAGAIRPEDVFDLLADLVDKSLVQQVASCARYRMLETVRQYALDRLTDSGEDKLVRCRHCDWFCLLAETVGEHASGVGASDWLDSVAEDHDNIRAALDWSIGEGEDADAALRMAGSLRQFWYQRGHSAEGLDYSREALAMSSPAASPNTRIRALNAAGLMAYVQADICEAADMYENAIEIARDLQEFEGLAIALNGLGCLKDEIGDFDGARACYTEALACSRAQPDSPGCETYLSNLGNVASRAGHYTAARGFLAEALEIGRKRGNAKCESFCLHGLGWTYHRETEYKRAETYYAQALEARRQSGFRLGEMETLFELGDVLLASGNSLQGRDRLLEALHISRDTNVPRWEAIVLARLGRALAEANEFAEARECLVRSARFFKDASDRDNLSVCLLGSAIIAYRNGDHHSAATLLGASRHLREECSEAIHLHDRQVWRMLEEPLNEAIGETLFNGAKVAGEQMVFEEAAAFGMAALNRDPVRF